MDVKQILITVTSRFVNEGVKAAETSFRELAATLRSIGQEQFAGITVPAGFSEQLAQAASEILKTGQITQETFNNLRSTLEKPIQTEALSTITSVLNAISESGTVSNGVMDQLRARLSALVAEEAGAAQGVSRFQAALQSLSSVANSVVAGLNKIGSVSQSIQNGFSGMVSGIKNGILNLSGWNSIFGRVTLGMLTWQAWRTVADGFSFIVDSIVAANANMQVALNTFAALSGGSKETGQTYIDILRQISMETGASFDELLQNAKRLPTQVGQNFQAFAELTRMAITLSVIDPVQGLTGAFIALTNCMEGTAEGFRSLVRRFELGNMERVKQILDETVDPLEALRKIFEEAGLDAEKFTKAQMGTMPIALQGIIGVLRQFFRVLGEPVITTVTEKLVNLRDWLLKNQAAIEGLAQAAGAGFSELFNRASSFVGDILGLGNFDPMRWFDAGVEMLTNLADGMFTALTDYVLPTITQIATVIAGFFIGASPPPLGPLSQIREGGQHTIEAMVQGMIEGLSSVSLKELAQGITDNLINLEGQELRQEKAIDKLQDFVDEAAKKVQAARDRLQLFDLQTSDIPERYTRGRRRQLEMAIFAAEQEERRRKEALDVAKAQLKATKDYLSAQEKVLRVIEAQIKVQEKAEEEKKKGEISKELTPLAGFDPEKFKEQVEKWKAIFSDKLKPLFGELQEGFSKLADFARGALGAAPDQIRGMTEMYQLGLRLRQVITQIGTAIGDAAGKVLDFFNKTKAGWDSLDPRLRTVLLGILGGILFPKLALVAGISTELSDPGNLIGIAAIILGLLSSGIASKIVTLTVQIIPKLGGILATALGPWLTGAAISGAAPAAALILPVAILILEWWYGREELGKWFSGERVRQLKVSLDILGVTGLGKELFGGLGDELSKKLDEVLGKGTSVSIGDWLNNTADAIGKALTGSATQIEKGASEGIADPIKGVVNQLRDALVGHSLIPDLLTRIWQLFAAFPAQLTSPLTMLYTVITTVMDAIKNRWVADWAAMAMAAMMALRVTTIAFAQMRALQLSNAPLPVGAQANTAGAAAANAQAALTQAQQAITNLPFFSAGRTQTPPINLNLDAKETRRLMEEGVYNGILSLPAS